MADYDLEDLTSQDLKSLKRTAAIRAKEEEFEKKRRQEEERKRRQLEELQIEYESQAIRREEERVKLLKKQAELRAQRKAEIDRLNNRRDEKISAKYSAWLHRANGTIQEIIDDHLDEEERIAQTAEQARMRKADKIQAIKDRKKEADAANEELESRRNDENDIRQSQRDLKEISRVDRLKSEAQEELESFILNPYPVPLKQVLAGRLRPVPRVTELLAAYRDTREDLDDLEAQDIPTRALLRNQSIFSYVRDIQLKAEEARVRPPEPAPGDLGRRANATTRNSMGAATRKGASSTRFKGTR